MTGIQAWEACVLPLNYARAPGKSLANKGFWRKGNPREKEHARNERRGVVIFGAKTPTELPRVFAMRSEVG